MITTTILSRLKDLKYQGKIKKFNVSITSKNNEFGDIVKFYAQINKEDIIQNISFKATGCTAFIAVCSYFCEMIEGKSIANALKINQEKINTIVNLDERREHVFQIILNTFALLVKKYRKGVEDKSIIPSEVEENATNVANEKSKEKAQETKKSSQSKNSSINKSKLEKDNTEVEIISVDKIPTKPEDKNNTSTDIFQDEIKKVQSEHINNLHNLVDNHENITIENSVNHSHDLSYPLKKVKDGNAHKMEHKTTITTTTTKTVSVSSNSGNVKSSLEELQKVNDEKNAVREASDILDNEPKKKKSFLGLFKRK